MVILKVCIFIIFCGLINLSAASENLAISKVNVDCLGRAMCTEVIKYLKSFEGRTISKPDLYKDISFQLNKPFYKSLQFDFNKGVLNFQTEVRDKIVDLDIYSEDEILRRRIVEDLQLKTGDYYDEDIFDSKLKKIQDLYFKNNFNDLKVGVSESLEGVKIRLSVKTDSGFKFNKVKINGLPKSLTSMAEVLWSQVKGMSWSQARYKRKIDDLKVALINRGFWSLTLQDKVKKNANGTVDTELNISLGLRYGFDFRGVTYFEHQELLLEFRKVVQNRGVLLTPNVISQTVNSLYKSRGVFYNVVNVRVESSKNKEVDNYEFFFIDIKEGQKVEVAEVNFSGNQVISSSRLQEVYDLNSSSLLSRGYLDAKGLEDVNLKLREFYISNGFVFSEIEEPIIVFSDNGSQAYITFKISEKSKYQVRSILIKGIDDQILETKIKNIMTNKEGSNFDVTAVDKDLKRVLDLVKEEGYYFTSFTEKNPKKIISLSSASKSIDINLKFDTGKKSYLGDVIVTGNINTKEIVIKRALGFKTGELVTPSKMNTFVQRLRTLGLFSRVNITPFVGSKKGENDVYLNFIVKVKEKAFGRGEVAPGYRTDLGYKVSGTVSYNNWGGMNRSIIVKAQANIRTSQDFLASQRKEQDDAAKLEGLVQLQYVEPYLFNFPVEWKMGLKTQRKRYANFDADIFSLTPTLTKEINSSLTASLEYEYDIVRQYKGVTRENEGRYRVGSITPNFTLDLRDNPVAPRSGAWFNFSWEFANPYFFSQDDPDFKINYNRAMLKSFFYFPVSKVVFATALTLGAEKNFATEALRDDEGNILYDSDGSMQTIGYIPTLKVFRLSSGDVLRGYSDDESNRLSDGTDISDFRVRNTAYLINFKFEPRYYLGDTSVIALFFDAGRVFKNHLKPLDLRTSVGFSFKVLTPVGSLDFDYGVKLKRERYDNGDREKFGRLHVSIGQF